MPGNLTRLATDYPTPTAPSYKSLVLAAGPELYLRFNDGAGATTAADASGNGRDATMNGGYVFGADSPLSGDASAGSVALDGASGWPDVPAMATVIPGESVSLACWVKVTSTTTWILACKNSAGNPHAYLFGWNGTLFAAATNGVTVGPSSAAIFDGGWHQIAWVLTQGGAKLYIDGALAFTSASVVLGGYDVASDLAIGYSFGFFFPGKLAELAIFPYALTAAQIANIYGART